ncbi:hypothetical protein [Roseobacter sp. HKCCA0434]|uniref:hypothetical protein n=1 Tax=Roseobacter sp. HKCCA0434 TaxID=3079297 RepID=UPI002905E62E|nr:hypothetical protein [Roseobacter sp. HKCCA0434]
MRQILALSLPLTVWLASFSAIYGLQGLTCSPRWPFGEGLARPALILAALAAVGLQAALVVRAPRGEGLMPRTTLMLSIVSLVAIMWTSLPAVFLTRCG